MDSHYVLPVALAAALHGAVLFGFNHKRPIPPVAKAPTTTLIPITIPPPPPEEPLPVEETVASTTRKAMPDTPAPIRQPEPPSVGIPAPFKIPPPPVTVEKMSDGPIVPFSPGVRNGGGDSPFGPDILGIGALDKTPGARLQAAPFYPYEAKREGVTGEVLVEFIVDESGSVLEPRVVRSSHRVFEDASLRAVGKWKFEPGRRNGRVVRYRMAVPVVFNLNE